MKAVCIHAPGNCSVVERAIPSLQPGQVLLRIERVAFCGSDLSTYQGRNPLVCEPRIIGHELAATIADIGDGVSNLSVGQLVTAMPYKNCGTCSACRIGRINACRNNETLGVQRDGAMADLIAIDAKDVIVAGHLDALTRATIEPLSIGFHAVARAEVTKIDTVLVIGCGMIGLGAVAAAKAAGARVLAADLSQVKVDQAAAMGAEGVQPGTDDDVRVRIAALTDGEGPTVVIEAVGAPSTYRLALDVVAFAGRIAGIGYAKVDVPITTSMIVKKEIDWRGARNATRNDFTNVISALSDGRVQAAPFITSVVPVAEAPQALAAWSENPGASTRIQVTW